MPENENTPPIPADTPEARAEVNAKVALANPDMVPDKFKNEDGSVNGDALLQSYLHMEQKMSGAPDTEDQLANEQPEAVTDPAHALVEGDSTPDSDSLAEAFDGPEIPEGSELWNRVEKEFSSSGELTPETFKALKEAGVPDALIASASYGRQAKMKSDMDKAYAITGGKEDFDATMNWAKDNLNDTEREAVSEGLKGSNALVILEGLHARRVTAQPASSGQIDTGAASPSAIGGTSDANLRPFENSREQHAALSDPRYGSDPEYQKQVDKRLMVGSGINPEDLRRL